MWLEKPRLIKMNETSTNEKVSPPPQFDESYFRSGPYAQVSFARYSQYWWSNRFYARLAQKHGPRQGRVLEIGCGLGHLLEWFTMPQQSRRYQVYGTDINPSALHEARRNVPQAHFLVLSAEDLSPLVKASFHIIIAKHVVEHLPDPERAIAEASRLLAPGGLFLMATPNLDSPMRVLKKGAWIGYQDPTHISLKSPNEWLALLRKHHLQPEKIFSDGFWDSPYLPWVPRSAQKLLFGWPGGLQAILGWSIIPLRLGESLIVIANKSV
jgi:SAM-dependent methyltransferase